MSDVFNATETFDIHTFSNRRFMYNPDTETFVFGVDKDSRGSHATEFHDSGCTEDFDDFVRGWIGTGKDYPDGIIHFAPCIPRECAWLYNKAYSVIDALKHHGLNGNTVIRGFGAVWERKAKEIM